VLYAYPAYLLELNRAAGAGMVTAQSMINLRGLLTAWIGKAPSPGPVHWVLLPVAIGALGYAAWIWRNSTGRHEGTNTEFSALAHGYSLAIVTAILTSYYAYSYDMTLLLVPLFLLVGCALGKQPGVRRGQLLTAASLLLICTPLYWAFLRWECLYLLCLPMLGLAAGLILALQERTPASL
jgi:hypothetical protein